MNRQALQALYAPITPTSDPRILVGHNGPRRNRDYVTLCRDDLGDWDRTGPVYPTKAEALSRIPVLLRDWFGE